MKELEQVMSLINQSRLDLVSTELRDPFYMTELGGVVADIIRNHLLVHLGNYTNCVKFYKQITRELDNFHDHPKHVEYILWNYYTTLDAAWRSGARKEIDWILADLDDRISELSNETVNLWIVRFGRLKGIIHYLRGDIGLAKSITRRIRKIAMSEQYDLEIAILNNNLGYFFRLQGEIARALYYHKKALPILERYDFLQHIANCYDNMALCYLRVGEFDRVNAYLTKSLKIREEMGNSYYLSWTLYHIIRQYFLRQDLKSMETYLKKLEFLISMESNHDIKNRYYIAMGLKLRLSGSYDDQVKASHFFHQVIEDPYTTVELIMDAKLFLAELLVDEAFQSLQDQAIVEATQILDEIIGITRTNSMNDKLISSYILKSRLLLLKQDYVDGKAVLVTAHNISKERGLQFHQALLDDEIRDFDQTVRDMMAMAELSNSDLLTMVKFDDYFSDTLTNRISFYNNNQTFEALLFQHRKGRLYYYYQFGKRGFGEETISKLSGAVFSFISELNEDEHLEHTAEFHFLHYHIVVNVQENLILSLVTLSPSYAAYEYINHLMISLQENEHLWHQLNLEKYDEKTLQKFTDLLTITIDEETRYFVIEMQ